MSSGEYGYSILHVEEGGDVLIQQSDQKVQGTHHCKYVTIGLLVFLGLMCMLSLVVVCETTSALPYSLCFKSEAYSRLWFYSKNTDAILTVQNSNAHVNITFYGNKSDDGITLSVYNIQVVTNNSNYGLSLCDISVNQTTNKVSMATVSNTLFTMNWVSENTLLLSVTDNGTNYVLSRPIQFESQIAHSVAVTKYFRRREIKYQPSSSDQPSADLTGVDTPSNAQLCKQSSTLLDKICTINEILLIPSAPTSICAQVFQLENVGADLGRRCKSAMEITQIGTCALSTFFPSSNACSYAVYVDNP